MNGQSTVGGTAVQSLSQVGGGQCQHGCFQKIRKHPQNGWFIMENPIKIDDLGKPTIFGNIHMDFFVEEL